MTDQTNVPTLRYSCKQSVDVNRGLANNWKRCFKNDDIRVPEGWVRSLEINGRMYSFAFISMRNSAKCPDGNYIVVKDNFSREQALGSEKMGEKVYYILPVMAVLRPQQEDAGPRLSVDEYLKEYTACRFTETCLEKARREKRIRVN
jgi:hypothetical protein